MFVKENRSIISVAIGEEICSICNYAKGSYSCDLLLQTVYHGISRYLKSIQKLGKE